jgi:hypothetical protein
MPDPQANPNRPRRAVTVSLTVSEWQRLAVLLRRLRDLALRVARNPSYPADSAERTDARETVRVMRRALFFIERDVPATKHPPKPSPSRK